MGEFFTDDQSALERQALYFTRTATLAAQIERGDEVDYKAEHEISSRMAAEIFEAKDAFTTLAVPVYPSPQGGGTAVEE